MTAAMMIPLAILGGMDGVEPLAAPREKEIVIRKRTTLERIEQVRVVYRGLTEAARLLGCSRAHLSYVLHGQRKPSESLARKLKRMGVEVEG